LPFQPCFQGTHRAEVITEIIILMTMLLTQFTFNTAATGIIAPIAVAAATAAGVSPYPFLMAVTMSASACFMRLSQRGRISPW
jgi:di/tricarboxylate transporter